MPFDPPVPGASPTPPAPTAPPTCPVPPTCHAPPTTSAPPASDTASVPSAIHTPVFPALYVTHTASAPLTHTAKSLAPLSPPDYFSPILHLLFFPFSSFASPASSPLDDLVPPAPPAPPASPAPSPYAPLIILESLDFSRKGVLGCPVGLLVKKDDFV